MTNALNLWLIILLTNPNIIARPMLLDGKEHVCFDRPSSQHLLQLNLNYPKLLQKVNKLERLKLTLDQQLAYMYEIEDILMNQIATGNKYRESLENELKVKNSWWRSPYLWMTVGIILGVGTTITFIELQE